MMEDGWSEVDYHYVTTMDACVLKQAKSTHNNNNNNIQHLYSAL